MKTDQHFTPMKWMAIITIGLFTSGLYGQSLPEVEARFANPGFDKISRNYYLDVELRTKKASEFLFGMNLRFFYDASIMSFNGIDQFHSGYGVLGDTPKVFVGSDVSGLQLFNFPKAAAFVNGAIQLLNEQSPLEIFSHTWVKAFRISFKVPISILENDRFCPSVIWDLKPLTGTGGFLPGGDGLVITVVERDRSTRIESTSTISYGLPFNWDYNGANELPYGHSSSHSCLGLTETVSVDHSTAKGYTLNQNQPNPFSNFTMIEFTLPYAQRASIVLYDGDGKVIEEIKGDFAAGNNQLILKDKTWMTESSIIYYRLHTDNYTSKAMKMTLVRA